MDENFQTIGLAEKIKNEKRRRHQTYIALNYLKSQKNKFDFFSFDTIHILKKANVLRLTFEKKKISTELLLLAFFDSDASVENIFEKFNLSFETIENAILQTYDSKLLNKKKVNNADFFTKNIPSFFDKTTKPNESLDYNYEVKLIFEKATENAFRFKTPVVTAEILFLTLLEEKNLAAGQLLKLFLKTDLEWNLLRYEILKKLHNEETKIQGALDKSSRYFAYLLKTELDNRQFEKLVQKNNFSSVILAYRNLVISKVLKYDLFTTIENEIKIGIKLNKIRTYST